MKIAAVHELGNCRVTMKNVTSGYDNIGMMFGNMWYGIQDAWGEEFDIVMVTGSTNIINYFLQNGKNPRWKKVLMKIEAGISVVNTPWYVDLLQQVDYDGFIVYSQRILEHYKMFHKPVIHWMQPYPFQKFPHLRYSAKDNKKVGLYMGRFNDPAANVIGTLALFNKMPSDVTGYCHVGVDELPLLEKIIKQMGLSERIFLKAGTSWVQYLEDIKDFKLFLSMDDRHTLGRFDMDAAMVGSKCVGAYTEVKSILFPELMVNCTEIDKAAELAIQVLNEPDNYLIPAEKEQLFNHDIIKEHLISEFIKFGLL